MKEQWLIALAALLLAGSDLKGQPMPTGWRCETCGASGPAGRSLQHKSGYSCSGQSSNYYGGYSPQVQMAQNLLQPLFNEVGRQMAESLLKLLRGKTPEEKAQRAYEKNLKQMKKIQEHLDDSRKDFERELLKELAGRQTIVARELEKRFVQSEAMTAIKQMNCAAFGSLQATRAAIISLDEARALSDFSSGNVNECPPVQYDVSEVTPQQRVAFQEIYYGMVKQKSDSLRLTLDSLKAAKEKNQQELMENKQQLTRLQTKVTAIKSQPPEDADSLLAAALRELEIAQQLQKKAEEGEAAIRIELENKEAVLETLEILRSAYDREKTSTPTPSKQIP